VATFTQYAVKKHRC